MGKRRSTTRWKYATVSPPDPLAGTGEGINLTNKQGERPTRRSLGISYTSGALQLLDELAHSLVYGKYDSLSRSNAEHTRCDALVERSVALLTPHVEGNCRYPLECALAR